MQHIIADRRLMIHQRWCKSIFIIIIAETSIFYVKMSNRVKYISVQKYPCNKLLQAWYYCCFDSSTIRSYYCSSHTRVEKTRKHVSYVQYPPTILCIFSTYKNNSSIYYLNMLKRLFFQNRRSISVMHKYKHIMNIHM